MIQEQPGRERKNEFARRYFGGRRQTSANLVRLPLLLLLFSAVNTFLGICYVLCAWLGGRDTEMMKKKYVYSKTSALN